MRGGGYVSKDLQDQIIFQLYMRGAEELPEGAGLEWFSYNSGFEVLRKQFSSVIRNFPFPLPHMLEVWKFYTLGEVLSEWETDQKVG